MRNCRKIGFAILLLLMHSILTGCMPSNVRVQVIDKQFVSPINTNLVAGLRKIEDKRPETEKENDQYYERTSQATVNENLYKNLKLSGIFQDVLYENFDNNNVDVILDPNVDHFFYEARVNGFTVFNLLFAFTGFPSLIYQLAGGPNGEHYGEASLGIKMSTIGGNVLASGSGETKLSVYSNLHNHKSDGLGIMEGRALSDATYDTLKSFSMNIKFDELPNPKYMKSNSCGSDKDCKGQRICVDGKCVNPNLEKKILGARLELMEQK